jgi:hypothetical protein
MSNSMNEASCEPRKSAAIAARSFSTRGETTLLRTAALSRSNALSSPGEMLHSPRYLQQGNRNQL